jgi:hypothetical protein
MVLSIKMNVIPKAIPLNLISTKCRTVNLIRTCSERIPFPRSVIVSAAKREQVAVIVVCRVWRAPLLIDTRDEFRNRVTGL